ncbi:MAG: sensor histidine kinase [Bacteroidaceae bacterium]|nr:sensor histidine kinase [Bacteroidaceae bacterium]
MKLPLKKIIILVIVSLSCIFAYQIYWLTGLYRTQLKDTEIRIMDCMVTADIREMMARVDSLRQGVMEDTIDKNKSVTTITRESTTQNETHSDTLLQNGNWQNFSDYLRRALHSGVDELTEASILIFDSLLSDQLRKYDLYQPHKVEFVQYLDSTVFYHLNTEGNQALQEGKDTVHLQYEDTIIVSYSTPGYQPSAKAKQYAYIADMQKMVQYRITMERPISKVLKNMTGILATSFFILLILAFAFIYLIRTLIKMRTLEEMKSDFTNNITHELKTPIAVAYAANDALLNFDQNSNPQKTKHYLQICQEQLERLSGLVEQILSISLERRKTMTLKKEHIVIKEVVEKLMEQYRLKTDQNLDITYEESDAGLTVYADRIHFFNMLSNLIDNAIKYSPENLIVKIKAFKQSNTINIEVTDHGIGIAPDKQALIFERFYRVPHGNLHDVKGYGLGLYYVKCLMEKHEGFVRLQSAEGKGSTFILIFQET